MVDMFTVMVVFLLQNYATTNQVLPLADNVDLPKASAVKELKPSNVVVLSREGVQVNNETIVPFEEVTRAEDWLITKLKERVEVLIAEGEEAKLGRLRQIRQTIAGRQDDQATQDEIDDFRKMTIQADRAIDFLSVKKIMFTVTEAGIYEINFAVIKRPDVKGENKQSL
jgi:biopolymer transport protein ExbD